MKILYAIQGTGNGHLSRAKDVIPILQKKGKLDLLVSGAHSEVSLPCEVKYRLKGMGFIFGKKGGIDYWRTYRKINICRFRKEIRTLPVTTYDLVVNDFEPISAWAARSKNVPCFALSHQAAVLNKNAPKPKKNNWLGKSVLRYYAPAQYKYGFHFKSYDENIFTPLIRRQIREQDVKRAGHYTVYLPAYGDENIINILSQFSDIKWEVFSKHTSETYRRKNIFIMPIHDEAFVKSMAACEGVLCGAGFETSAEALFLGKKLLVVPMRGQYEQQCNAAALKQMGVPVLKNLKEENLPLIETWLNNDEHISVNYPDDTEYIVDKILHTYLTAR